MLANIKNYSTTNGYKWIYSNTNT